MVKHEIEVGKSLRDVLAEVGQLIEPSSALVFVDWAALCAVLTPKRYELMRYLRRQPELGVRALARGLGRDVTRVHQDVAAFEELGLLRRDPDTGAISTDSDAISSVIRFAA